LAGLLYHRQNGPAKTCGNTTQAVGAERRMDNGIPVDLNRDTVPEMDERPIAHPFRPGRRLVLLARNVVSYVWAARQVPETDRAALAHGNDLLAAGAEGRLGEAPAM